MLGKSMTRINMGFILGGTPIRDISGKLRFLYVFLAFVFLATALAKTASLSVFPQTIPQNDPILSFVSGRWLAGLGVFIDVVLFLILNYRLHLRRGCALFGYVATLLFLLYHAAALLFGRACGCAGKWALLSPGQQSALDSFLLLVCIIAHGVFLRSLCGSKSTGLTEFPENLSEK